MLEALLIHLEQEPLAVGPALGSKVAQVTFMCDLGWPSRDRNQAATTVVTGALSALCPGKAAPALAGPEGPGTKLLRKGQVCLLPDVLGDSSLVEKQLGHKRGQQLQGSLIRPQRAEYALPRPGAPKGGVKRDPRAASGSSPPTCFSQGSGGVTHEQRSQDT